MGPKIWFITGASRGFGRIWADAALKRGDKVAATARKLSSIADLKEKYGENVLTLELDVTNPEQVKKVVTQAHTHFGKLDIVLNNAGYSLVGTIEEASADDVRALYDTNIFASPGQVIGSDHTDTGSCSDYTLLIHPDFLWNYPLAKKIKQYGFFSYSANEALHLSEEEKAAILSIFKMIEAELNSRIDEFSQDVMIAHIELLLNYANRFYKRQFITRKIINNDLLVKLEDLLIDYINNDTSPSQGLPTVQYLAEQLHLSPGYLSDMLRSLIGQSAQQYIHEKLIERSKELLSTTSLSVSQIAFQLGFEHSQSFSKFFKLKAKLSPLQFRQSFN